MTGLDALTLAVAIAGCAAAGARFLRVAQREHYLARATTRFAWRWWASRPLNALAAAAALGGAGGAFVWAPAGLAPAIVALLGPVGLGVRGRSSPLAWTRRLRTVAACSGAIATAAVALAGALAGLAAAAVAAAVTALAAPLVVDAALALLAPIENRLAARYVADAARRLAAVSPRVVAITGSYGKTSTKGYVAHLLATRFAVVASPRSFNNRAGLARTVNEQLQPGTHVLVAEMGTFGPGEIAAMCRWMPPDVAVITAVGPVHLERFGSVEAILAAKSEITEGDSVCVLNVDDERLAGLAGRLAGTGRSVLRCSGGGDGSATAEVCVRLAEEGRTLSLEVRGEKLGSIERSPGAPPVVASNVACAVGAALAAGMSANDLLALLADLPGAANRLAVDTSPSGVIVLDDTYNSNPAGARVALAALAGAGRGGARRVLVTPGMVELGSQQASENEALGRLAVAIVDDLVVVGRTNRRALLAGASSGPAVVRWVATREEAVGWVRTELQPGDAVLYENDLPDHYP